MDPNDLLSCFIWQKQQLLKEAGSDRKAVADWETAKRFYGSAMEKMAVAVRNWDVTPDILMSAAFAWARKCRHFSGPHPNMLASTKFLTQALSFYLEVPKEIVEEMKSMERLMSKYDEAFQEHREAIATLAPEQLIVATSVPATFRYIVLRQAGSDKYARMLAAEVLDVLFRDARLRQWAARQGYAYDDIAAHFNVTTESGGAKAKDHCPVIAMERFERPQPLRLGGKYHCEVCGTHHQVGFCPARSR